MIPIRDACSGCGCCPPAVPETDLLLTQLQLITNTTKDVLQVIPLRLRDRHHGFEVGDGRLDGRHRFPLVADLHRGDGFPVADAATRTGFGVVRQHVLHPKIEFHLRQPHGAVEDVQVVRHLEVDLLTPVKVVAAHRNLRVHPLRAMRERIRVKGNFHCPQRSENTLGVCLVDDGQGFDRHGSLLLGFSSPIRRSGAS